SGDRGVDAAVRRDHCGGHSGGGGGRHGDLVPPAPLAPRGAPARGGCPPGKGGNGRFTGRGGGFPDRSAAASGAVPGRVLWGRRARQAGRGVVERAPSALFQPVTGLEIRARETMPLLVKICGLSTRETLDAALAAGADMVGFVFFPPSPRHLGLEAARELGRQAKGRAAKVALTVDADDATLENIVETLQPDLLQLHGKETIARVRDIKAKFALPVMKVIAVETSVDLAVL